MKFFNRKCSFIILTRSLVSCYTESELNSCCFLIYAQEYGLSVSTRKP